MSILLVGGYGGHGEQLGRIRKGLLIDKCYALLETGFDWNYNDYVYYTPRVVDYHRRSVVRSTIKFINALVSAYRIIKDNKIKQVVSTGPALSVPICLVASILRVKVIHIESWSRIHTISNTTKLILTFRLADVVIYQYKDHILAGRPRCEYWGHL